MAVGNGMSSQNDSGNKCKTVWWLDNTLVYVVVNFGSFVSNIIHQIHQIVRYDGDLE